MIQKNHNFVKSVREYRILDMGNKGQTNVATVFAAKAETSDLLKVEILGKRSTKALCVEM